jgi:hypothetical protein|tara:strand:+ start:249 stop:653 length:405 start_codon:yes stop_codon:yes gene_type:complete
MAKKFRKIKLEEIDAETTEGKLLLMAISQVKTITGAKKENACQLILDSLTTMASEVYFDDLNLAKPLQTRVNAIIKSYMRFDKLAVGMQRKFYDIAIDQKINKGKPINLAEFAPIPIGYLLKVKRQVHAKVTEA